MRVLPLAGFPARTLPTPEQAPEPRELGQGLWTRRGSFWANRSDGALAIQSIEFGNETSYGYQYGDSAESPSYTASRELCAAL